MSARAAVVWPPLLEPGAVVGVLAPAGPVRLPDLSRGIRALRERGFGVKLGESVKGRWHYLAAPDAARLDDLHSLWSDERVAAIWCARGGYGTMRLLPAIDWELLRRRPLPLIGYSDITALQLAAYAKTGLVSFSGPMIGTLYGYGAARGIDPDTEAGLWTWLGPQRASRSLENPPAEPLRVLQPGRASGCLIGGNLSLVAGLVGTPYLPSCDGAILVLEDVDEMPYRVDRMLTQLKLAGLLDRIAGVLLGDFANCFPPAVDEPGPPLAELLLERLDRPDVPVMAGLAYGHLRRRCTIPVGARAEMDTSTGRIVVEVGEVTGR